jgi:hypothetical protein
MFFHSNTYSFKKINRYDIHCGINILKLTTFWAIQTENMMDIVTHVNEETGAGGLQVF